MAQTSDELRTEIERTREEMSGTVDALAYKANVPSRTKEWLGDKKEAVVAKVGGVQSKANELTPDGREVRYKASRVRRTIERNPLGLAIAGASAGFIAGVLAPSTRLEDERIGPMSDELKSTAVEAGKEAVERGKLVAQEMGQTAVDTAKESGREQGEELAASLQDSVKTSATTESAAARTHSAR
jgi:hypothetical protein